MGYSGRYHAASLAAVFLALAIGILIGAEFGGDVVSNTRKNLEKSITADLTDARGRADELAGELGRANEFGDRIYPVLVSDKLAGRRVGILGLGGLPGSLSNDIESALEPTGASLVAVGVIREPPDVSALAGDLSGTRFADIDSNPDTVQALGTGFGRQLVIGGNLLEKVGSKMFSRVSGRFGNLDGLVVVRDAPQNLGNADSENTTRMENGILDGVSGTAVNAVGVEATDADPSSISFFDDHHLSTVDDIDLPSGKVATIFALLGAEGQLRNQGERRPSPARPAGPGTGGDPAATRLRGRRAGWSRPRPDLAARASDLDRLPGRPRGRAADRPHRRPGPARRRPARENYRGRTTAFPLGAVIATSALVALAPLAFLDDRADLNLLDPDLRRWITYVIGVAFLGFLDDALGRAGSDGSPRGWRGHAEALRAGSLSTGAIKAIGALALAAYVVSGTGRQSLAYLADVALLILATNLFNLLDLRPGRAEKALLLVGAGLCIGGWTIEPIELLGIFAGPILIGAAFTLTERAMLGDTGSNLVGAVAGVWLLTDARSDRPADCTRPDCSVDGLWGVSLDLRGDLLDSSAAITRLARES